MEDLNSPDEESQRLLDELGDREQLEAKAKELGVKFKGNIGDDALRQRVADAIKELNPDGEKSPDGESGDDSADNEDDQSGKDNDLDSESEKETVAEVKEKPPADNDQHDEPLTITNKGKNLRRIEGIELAAGDSCTLTEVQMNNKSLMGKVNRMIELKIFVRS